MPYPPELLRHQALAVGSSFVLSFVGMAAIFDSFRSHESNSMVVIGLGSVMLFTGLWLAWLSTSWYRRAARLVSTGKHHACTVTLVEKSDSDSTTLYAVVGSLGKPGDQPFQVAILRPGWEYRSLVGAAQSAELFVNASSSKPVAISTDLGMLWCIPHNTSTNELGAG